MSAALISLVIAGATTALVIAGLIWRASKRRRDQARKADQPAWLNDGEDARRDHLSRYDK